MAQHARTLERQVPACLLGLIASSCSKHFRCSSAVSCSCRMAAAVGATPALLRTACLSAGYTLSDTAPSCARTGRHASGVSASLLTSR